MTAGGDNQKSAQWYQQRTEEMKGDGLFEDGFARNEITYNKDIPVMTQSSRQDTQMDTVKRAFGTWESTKADDIETYLVGQQRRFVKYRLNIFVLNRVSIFIMTNPTFALFCLKFKIYLLNLVCPKNPTQLLQIEAVERREVCKGTKDDPGKTAPGAGGV